MTTDSTDDQKPGVEQKAARGGDVIGDRSKNANSGDKSEPRPKGGVIVDDRSKDFGGPEDHPKA